MAGYSKRNLILLISFILIFGLIFTFIGEFIGQNIKVLSFLKEYKTIGMYKPLVLDLNLISLTFAVSFKVNILSLFGMLIGYLIFRKM